MKLFMQENLTEKERDTGLKMILDTLEGHGELVLACLTGSRAFGWGGRRYDRDFRVVYHHPEVYWNYAHIGYRGNDINAEDLEALLNRIRWRWTAFEDLSKPLYIDDRFDFEGFQSFCSVDQVKSQRHTTDLELDRLRGKELNNEKRIRKALHCYRQLMCPAYFLETGKMEINVLEINKTFDMKQLPILADLYRERNLPFPEVDWKSIWEELDLLEERLEADIVKYPRGVDEEALEKWKTEMRGRFNEN